MSDLNEMFQEPLEDEKAQDAPPQPDAMDEGQPDANQPPEQGTPDEAPQQTQDDSQRPIWKGRRMTQDEYELAQLVYEQGAQTQRRVLEAEGWGPNRKAEPEPEPQPQQSQNPVRDLSALALNNVKSRMYSMDPEQINPETMLLEYGEEIFRMMPRLFDGMMEEKVNRHTTVKQQTSEFLGQYPGLAGMPDAEAEVADMISRGEDPTRLAKWFHYSSGGKDPRVAPEKKQPVQQRQRVRQQQFVESGVGGGSARSPADETTEDAMIEAAAKALWG
jgi:hypothetical protein